MKKLSLLLAAVLMFSCIGGAFAEEASNATTETELLAQDCGYSVIDADEDAGQIKLSYMEGVTPILEVDGLKFKDLNKNGTLDIYEDWRQEAVARLDDLVSQMTEEELIGDMLCINADLEQARNIISEFNMNCLLFNLNGTPITITNTLNNLQAKAEGERLGIPMIFTSDREYNAFGGYIDKSHEAFGTAYDPELAYNLAYYYGQAMNAIGIHVTFEPYAEEIGAQYGENPELIAKIITAEISGLEESGFASCTKHWIGRGGDSSFGNARSIAQNFDNWMVGWKAAINAGAEWVMTNCAGTGITNTCDVKWDKETMSYLRDTLGFNGIIVTDWWPFGFSNKVTGITPEGIDLADQSYCWLFNEATKNGVDMYGTGTVTHGTVDYTSMMKHYPDDLVTGLKSGEIEMDAVVNAVKRINLFRITKGLFEDPYNDVNAAVTLCASAEWAANPTEIHSNEDLRAARNPLEVEMSEKLQAESAVLVKNDNNLLPLSKNIKVYLESANADRKTGYSRYIGNFATVVETMAEADVLVGDFSAIDDVTELFIEDAQAAGKPIVLTLNNLDPDLYTLENADAVIYMSYNQKADHGSTEAGFITETEPWIYADLLFGEKEPGGVIVKEIARDIYSDASQWKDLAGDQGASPYVRLMVQGAMMADTEYHASPNNWGDPLVQALYGMSYGKAADFSYSCFILPITQTEQEGEDSRGNKTTVVVNDQTAKVGEPFTVYCLLSNNGADGITMVQVKDGENIVAEKLMTVTAGSWRVVKMDVTLDTVGEHTLTIGDQTGIINITQ